MKKPTSPTESYLQELSKSLEALGPAQAEDVIAEVRGLVADAVAESGGDEDSALASFGPPAALATEILRERGIIVEASTVPEAPRWMRRVALAIDVAVTLLAAYFAFFFLAFGFLLGDASWPEAILPGLAVLVGAGIVLWLVLRWVRERRRGEGTLGMRVMQIRNVRVGQDARVVRTRDIPGLKPGIAGKVAWGIRIVGTLAVLTLLVGAVWGVVHNLTRSPDGLDPTDRALQTGTRYGVSAVNTVQGLYDAVMQETPAQDLSAWLAPEATAIAASLRERVESGELASYQTWDATLTDYTWPEPELTKVGEAYQIQMKVNVTEYAQGSDQSADYSYTVTATRVCTHAEESDYTSSYSYTETWVVTSERDPYEVQTGSWP